MTLTSACDVIVPRLPGRRLELAPTTPVQPWLWFFGMLLFSILTHLTGLMGMPRRVFEPRFADHAAALDGHRCQPLPTS